jgi:hypothetical protein
MSIRFSASFALDAPDDSGIMSLPVHQITKQRRDVIAMLSGDGTLVTMQLRNHAPVAGPANGSNATRTPKETAKLNISQGMCQSRFIVSASGGPDACESFQIQLWWRSKGGDLDIRASVFLHLAAGLDGSAFTLFSNDDRHGGFVVKGEVSGRSLAVG